MSETITLKSLRSLSGGNRAKAKLVAHGRKIYTFNGVEFRCVSNKIDLDTCDLTRVYVMVG